MQLAFHNIPLTQKQPFPNPDKALLLTFDDGYAGLAQHAYPVLAEVGFTATTFLVTDYVGRTNTWDARYTALIPNAQNAELKARLERLDRRIGGYAVSMRVE